MLIIEAQENAIIKTIENQFPLGQRNTIKINIKDNILKEYIENMNTGTSLQKYNLYSYGEFNSGLQKVTLDLNLDSYVKIVPFFRENQSFCLEVETTNKELGLGLCQFVPDKSKLVIGTDYIFSCDIYVDKNSLVDLNLNYYTNGDNKNTKNIIIEKIESLDCWQHIRIPFTAEYENFFFNLEMQPQEMKNIAYLDNIQLFEAEYEIVDSKFDNVEFEVEILNPCQQKQKINRIINYSKPEDEETYILLYFPPITVVDSQDNILCNLVVNLYQEPYNNYLDNIKYNKIKETVYKSAPFILNGFILADNDNVELVVERI